MTNHIHLLLLPQTVTGLINFMKVLGQRYTQYFNRTYHRTGELWENRYKLHPFEPESNSALLRYVEQNPLRAGIVDNVIDYPWSSVRNHLTGKFDPYIIVTPRPKGCPRKTIESSREIGAGEKGSASGDLKGPKFWI